MPSLAPRAKPGLSTAVPPHLEALVALLPSIARLNPEQIDRLPTYSRVHLCVVGGILPEVVRIGTRYYYDPADVPLIARKLGLKLPASPTTAPTPQRTRERRRSAMKEVVAVGVS
jgi:hypothetical protein